MQQGKNAFLRIAQPKEVVEGDGNLEICMEFTNLQDTKYKNSEI